MWRERKGTEKKKEEKKEETIPHKIVFFSFYLTQQLCVWILSLVTINTKKGNMAIDFAPFFSFSPFCPHHFFSPSSLHGTSTNARTIPGTIYIHAFQPTSSRHTRTRARAQTHTMNAHTRANSNQNEATFSGFFYFHRVVASIRLSMQISFFFSFCYFIFYKYQ